MLCNVRLFPKQALVFTCLQYKSFENFVGIGEIARNKQFLLFPHCFLPFWRTSYHFHQIQNCHQQTLSVWMSLKFVVWERVKKLSPSAKPQQIISCSPMLSVEWIKIWSVGKRSTKLKAFADDNLTLPCIQCFNALLKETIGKRCGKWRNC